MKGGCKSRQSSCLKVQTAAQATGSSLTDLSFHFLTGPWLWRGSLHHGYWGNITTLRSPLLNSVTYISKQHTEPLETY